MSLESIKTKIKEAILKYEREELSFDETQTLIKTLTQKEVTQYTLDNYWRSEDLEELVEFLVTEEIQNWQELNDTSALKLIKEIIENIVDGAILERNGNALEKKYQKSKGTVMDLIFQEDITLPSEILKRLKTDTTIKL